MTSEARPLRVLVELGTSDRRIGAVNDALDLAHYGTPHGAEFLLCGPVSDDLAAAARREGMRVVRGCSRQLSKRGIVAYAGSVALWLVRLLALRPHVVHLNYAAYGPSLAFAARLLGIPIVARAVGEYTACNRLHQWTAIYVANGDAHAGPLRNSPLAQRVRVTGDLFRPERVSRPETAKPIPRRTAAVRFLFLGQLVERKGLVTLLDAFAETSADADLVLAGGDWNDSGYPALLKRRIRELGIEDRVHCENHREDIGALLEDCDVLVLPSQHEARPRVIIEAMCKGRPVIASRVGGIPELLDAHSGILVSPGDVGAWRTAIEALATSANLRDRLGSGARARAAREFDPDRTARSYLAVYRELAGFGVATP